ncbi:MAG: ABC transporter ATP-binding protein, partial [Muribaculaceae bacterium]|nr:ABC transporter ATP-binding protein [Muribaculaceae bacterium]
IIMDNIYKYYKDRTLIIAAHRLSTVYRADHIMLLDGGQIVEAGTHNQLLAINGKYKKLIDSQIIKD